jgi:hypothetical protein
VFEDGYAEITTPESLAMNDFRGANPLSCYSCKLKEFCPGYNSIDTLNILSSDRAYLVDGELDNVIKTQAEARNCTFVCITEELVPKKIYKKMGSGNKKKWTLIDEFSGYALTDQRLDTTGIVSTVGELINQLPTFQYRH